MIDLVKLIRSLSPKEAYIIKNLYRLKTKGNGESKRLKMFEVIYNKKVMVDTEIAHYLFHKPPDSNYSHLKSRLKNDIYDMMLVFPNMEGAKKNIELYCFRLLYQSKILIEKNLNREAYELLKKAANLAEKYEYADLCVSIHESLRSIGISNNGKSRITFDRLIHDDIVMLSEYLESQELRLTFGKLTGDPVVSLVAKKKESAIRSKRLRNWHDLLKMKLFIRNGQYFQAQQLGKQLLYKISENKTINPTEHKALAYIEMAIAALYLNKLKESSEYASSAVTCARGLHPLEFLAKEQAFFSFLRLGDIKNALQMTSEVAVQLKFDKYPLIARKWTYFEICLDFIRGDMRSALRRLGVIKLGKQEEPGFVSAVKSLELMCLSELQEYELFEFRLESFRKLIQRRNNKQLDRYKEFYQLLKTLLKSRFDYTKTLYVERNSFENLRSDFQTFKWNPVGLEIIRFDEWLNSKRVSNFQTN